MSPPCVWYGPAEPCLCGVGSDCERGLDGLPLGVSEMVEAITKDCRGDPQVGRRVGHEQCVAELVEVWDQPACRLRPDLPLDSSRLVAGVMVMDVHELVGEGASPLRL